MVFTDSFDDSISDAAGLRMPLFSEDIWKPRATQASGVSGTAINPTPIVPSACGLAQSENPIVDNTGMSQQARATGLRINVDAPALNHNRGHLSFGQIGQDVSKARHAQDKLVGSAQFAGLSFSEVGRFTDYPDGRYASPRPANHTWMKSSSDNNLLYRTQYDFVGGGTFTASSIASPSTETTFSGGGTVEAIVHQSVPAIPSNGLGIIYGDFHNSEYLTTIVSSPMHNTATSAWGYGLPTHSIDPSEFSANWCVNLLNQQPFVQTGNDISSPDGISGWSNQGATSEATQTKKWSAKTMTVQHILTGDVFDDGTNPAESLTHTPLGRVDLGASVVGDSVGLIGFEGVITATAFFSPTKNTDNTTPKTQGAITQSGSEKGYAGLNIQVSSGMPVRRNSVAASSDMGAGQAPYRYGSDGSAVEPMTDALSTHAGRASPHPLGVDVNANQSWFRNCQSGHLSNPLPEMRPPIIGDSVKVPLEGGLSEVHQGGAGHTRKIIGSNTVGGSDPATIDSSYSTGRWIADGIPTKVQIVPVITGYKDVSVSVGAAKSAAFPSAQPITFRKPLVDYHVLVSVIKPAHVPNAQADTTNPANNTGTLTNRNNPNPSRLHINADFSDTPATIYHGIFRIDPTTLEQIYVEAGQAAGLPMEATEFGCEQSVIVRHDWSRMEGGTVEMGWGLHQATPMRPIALPDTNTKVPDLCAAVEGGGSFQRGGISHLWDACEFGGEVFVGADVIDPFQLCITEIAKSEKVGDGFGQPDFGIWGRGQIWPDGATTPTRPQGCELLVWRYSPSSDPLYSPTSTALSNPIRTMFPMSASDVAYTAATCDNITRLSSALNESERKGALGRGAVWAIHDWVMPQIEMMRYLGREEKDAVAHPKSQRGVAGGSKPIYHPTLHCSSLRAMDDGRFTMAAVHIDYIKTENDYPALDIKYPLNPDLDTGGCPAGYYQSGGQCVPIAGVGDYPSGQGPDPQSGDVVPNGNNVPTPVNGSGGSTPKSDNFSAYPTWSKLMANTQARSLILMFSDIEADKDTGLAKRGRALFDITWEKVKSSDSTTDLIARQTWTEADSWWSGARISYWYQESGQRAIPMTYGSYPDCRMSYATLPRSLPFLVNEHDENPISQSARIQSGFPLKQPSQTAMTMNMLYPKISTNAGVAVSTWSVNRQSHLKLTSFVPTTIGFADFGAGANPHQELGWSGWSFPRGLFDPISYGDNTLFFSDAPESLDLTPAEAIAGTAIVPTEQAIFQGFGDNADDASGIPSPNPYSPLIARYVDLSTVSFPATLESMIVYKQGSPTERVMAPAVFGSIAELVAILNDPLQVDWMLSYDTDYEISSGGQVGFIESPSGTIARTYDPALPPPVEQANSIEWTSITISGTAYKWLNMKGTGHRLMRGLRGGWSHHGPLHYGVSTRLHPYRVDRVFKQVHGGVGYDLPIHLLKPAGVHVRARAGGKNSIELEMETPFHRTDNLHLLSAAEFNTGFDLGPANAPIHNLGGSRAVAGQYFLRTNLWDKPMFGSAGVSGSKIAPLDTLGARVHGPIVSGSFALEAFWSDHPTDHFHASAMPILPNTDYDLEMIESQRYSPLMLSRVNEIHELDVLAISEQLESSVDVHVSQTAKPMWDSGSIASAVGLGYADSLGKHMIQIQASMDGNSIQPPSTAAGGSGTQSQGMGQRQLRTPEGTLHQFFIRRSCQSGSQNYPQWTHVKKPLWGDLFWNRKAMKPANAAANFAGKDECGPLLSSIGAGASQSASHCGRVMGAAFASDSAGTIHAVIEIHPNPDDAPKHRAHRLYYTKATRKAYGSQPEIIYDWDWSEHTPVLIQDASGATSDGGTMFDLRMPSMVCDGDDRLHLVFQQNISIVGASGLPQCQRIFYTSKLPDEDSFPTFLPEEANSAAPTDNRYTVIHGLITDAGQTTLNQASAGPHYTTYNDCPKVVLRGDNIPVVFYRGRPIQSFATADRRYNAIYCNIGQSPNRVSDPSGRFTFDSTKCHHVVGLPPDSKNPMENKEVVFYDAIIDERDRAIVVSIKDDRETSPAIYAPRQTLITTFDTRKSLAEQYSTTDGLGTHITLWRGPVYDGTSELRKTDPNYKDISLTTDGKGNIHIVMTFTMIGDDQSRYGEIYRDAATPKVRQSALAPLIWAATPTGKENVSGVETPYVGGFIKPSIPPNWSGLMIPPMPPYASDPFPNAEHQHLLHCWIPSLEFDTTHNTLRSVNIRWLSVPSLRWDSANQTWSPVGSAQTMAGEEDFPHHSPQLRFQRFWGYDASEIDLRWFTNELAWYRTNTKGSDVFYPSSGGIQMELGNSIEGGGEGLAGYPSG